MELRKTKIKRGRKSHERWAWLKCEWGRTVADESDRGQWVAYPR